MHKQTHRQTGSLSLSLSLSLSSTHTLFSLKVGEGRDEDLVEEERAAVHLDRPREQAPKVIDIPEGRERGCGRKG